MKTKKKLAIGIAGYGVVGIRRRVGLQTFLDTFATKDIALWMCFSIEN